jgi:hypothetical protein
LPRPKSLKFTYRNRAIRTGVSIVSPIGSFGVGLVIQARPCIGAKPAASNKRKHDGAGQDDGMAHFLSPSLNLPRSAS